MIGMNGDEPALAPDCQRRATATRTATSGVTLLSQLREMDAITQSYREVVGDKYLFSPTYDSLWMYGGSQSSPLDGGLTAE